MTEKEQLEKLIHFLMDNGIVSTSKIAKIIGVSLLDFYHKYISFGDQELEGDDFNLEDLE